MNPPGARENRGILMRPKFSTLPSPVLAGVVRERTAGAARAEIRNCLYHGAGMIDLHLSCLDEQDEESLKKITSSTDLPVLALHYNSALNGQRTEVPEEERTELLFRAVLAGAAGVDLQGYAFDAKSRTAFCGEDRFSFTKSQPKEVVTDPAVIERQMEFIERVHREGAEVLLSCHPGVFLDRRQVVDLALFLLKRNPDVIKIVTVANDEDELAETFAGMIELKKELPIPVSFHAAGKAGALSRIVNPMLGGHIIFSVDRYQEGHTLAQPELKTAYEVVEGLKKITGK